GYYLIGLPSVGVYGASIGTVLCYAIAAAVNLGVLAKEFGRPFSFTDLTRPILPAALSFSLSYLLLSIMPDKASAFSTLFMLAVSAAL
ncbi:MAG: polysaccharide biosynthesis C-terminal domain-containing protein, partial [Clostridia bacterium]|nr:polysaccharide biosynthesis C-terminal domain-containing protein [Clostridia bacterium]